MNIENITVKYCHVGSFKAKMEDGIKHIKDLPYLSLVQATEGSYDFGLNKMPQKKLGIGEFFISPALARQKITHHPDPISGYMSARWVFMDIVVNDGIPFDLVFTLPTFPDPKLCRDIGKITDTIFDSTDIIGRKIGCYKLLELLLPHAVEAASRDPRVNLAVSYIHRHFNQHLTVDAIANAVNMSASNLYRQFKRTMGASPIDYCNSLKLSHACMLLGRDLFSVNEISELCGISDPFYFSRLFKKKFGISPMTYRRDLQSSRRK